MDIKVITRHGPSNYGSLLQSMAIIKIIENIGHECKIIDYQCSNERGLKAVLAAVYHKKGWNKKLIKKLMYVLIRYPMEFVAQHKFDMMRGKYLKMTSRFNTSSDLKKLKADIFMTGSDQVWGPVLSQKYDEAYFLTFVSKEVKKVAYAASFGRTDFNDNIVVKYKEMLSHYNAIAVRENSAVDLLRVWGIVSLGQVLDPTLMITSDEWEKLIKRKKIKGQYVLVYELHNNPCLCEYAKKFAKYVGLPLVRISPSFHQVLRGGKFIYLPDLEEFLSYIKNCTYFITDSFHGTVFALNFNKQFIEILPNNKTGSRNMSILTLTGLEDRIVTDFNNYSIVDKRIDYNKVNQILEIEREKSLQILKYLCNGDYN